VEQNPLLEKVEQNPLLEKVEQNLLWGDEGCVVDQNPLLEKVEQIHFWKKWSKSTFGKVEQNSIRFGLKGVILINK
jgi:hypothetical protein